MENPINPTPNRNENPRPTPNLNSVDGFSKPVQPPPNNDAVVSSISISPDESSNSQAPASSQDNKTAETEKASAPVLTAPVKSADNDQKRSKIWTIILIILILVVFAGGIYGVYAYQQKKINNQNGQINSLTSQASSLKSQLATLENAPSVSTSTQSSSNSSQSLFKIPELGISLTVPATLGDLTYVANSAKTAANLSTQNLATLDSSCTASLTVAPLGTITKTNGQFPASGDSTSTLIKQYSSYYIAYVKPSASCSSVTQVNNLANTLITDLKDTFSTVQLISS